MPNWIKFRNTMQAASAEWNNTTVTVGAVEDAIAEATQDKDCFAVYCRGPVRVPPPRDALFDAGMGICFQNVPTFVHEPNSDLYLCDLTPRNIVWVEDNPPTPAHPENHFDDSDKHFLTVSGYTHAIICFFHLDPGPKLVYNGTGIDPYGKDYDTWWDFLQTLRSGTNYKTLMLSVG